MVEITIKELFSTQWIRICNLGGLEGISAQSEGVWDRQEQLMCENEGGGWNDKLKDGCVEVRNETEAKMVQNSSAGSNTERQRVTLVSTTMHCYMFVSPETLRIIYSSSRQTSLANKMWTYRKSTASSHITVDFTAISSALTTATSKLTSTKTKRC